MTSPQYLPNWISRFGGRIVDKRNQIISVMVVICLVVGAGSQDGFLPMVLAGILFSFIAITDRAQQSTLPDGTKLSIPWPEYLFHYLVVGLATIAASVSFYVAFTAHTIG